MMKNRSVIVFTLLLGALAASACGTTPPRTPTSEWVKSALAKSRDAVAIVYPDGENRNLVGSGVFISPEGLMLTNDHVVERDRNGRMIVVASNGIEYAAKAIGRDSYQDVALVRVRPNEPTESFPYVELGDSDALRVGDWVMAIGNPLGIGKLDRQVTVTLGIVAAKHRQLAPFGSENFARYTDGLQTDASTKPGNSGGALVDMNGKLVGINGAGGEAGITGFAIPVNQIKRYLPRLKAGEAIVHADLKVEGRNLNIAESTRLLRGGFRVTKPAEYTGESVVDFLKPKDIILAIDGEPVRSAADLSRIVDRREPAQSITIELLRGDETVVQQAKLTEMKVNMELVNKSRKFSEVHGQAIGLLRQRKLAEALTKFQESLTILPDHPMAYYNIACTYSLMKNANKAFETMAKAYEHGMDDVDQLRTDPDLEFLRSDPRFEEFYKRMKKFED